MQALNVEDNTEGLRYEKVILATDADVDGMPIRNLMITYCFKFFEQLVHDGHVYVLETPLPESEELFDHEIREIRKQSDK